ncbi:MULTISPECIES: Gfo/Idh/MocA family oxidoreductase [unclassified Mesorhizobium]|uniref:Gfo/Idh/MocA family protein n=1 Tax=unclassified Mesorhizobium TaxID=325217 RepID=UPI00095C9808|nr:MULTISPECIES: Gfo/Idh/MocA family oxidoreductase [unclassified Mesorhizobium]MBN9254386.1 Gfo/Idh/MocA family oxidoreductase [Mesorhizobium sp.]OJX76285.1 MAG: oxidoreductase [Mesorhizobium sp. 65-26]
MVHATDDSIGGRRLRVGMVGGGRDAFIGAVHRLAIRLDDRIQLVAGALSSDPERARLSAADIGIAADRAYSSYQQMARAEAARADGIEAVVIVTPNHLHAPVAKAFLEAGIDVICDKPLSATLAQAEELAAVAAKSGLVFAVTFNNTGYAMVREARSLIASGALGKIRIIRADYIQDWLTLPIDADGQKQAEWRTDPERAGRSACLADIGVHAFNLARFVTDMVPNEVAADLTTFVPGRRLDDNAHVMMRYAGGARGVLVASQVSPGNYNRLSLKVYGEKAGLEWFAHEPEVLRFSPFGEPTRILTRGGPGVGAAAASVSRMPAEHPEGYVEGFANLYRDAAALIVARRAGRTPDPALVAAVPSIHDGLAGMRFIEAAVDSHENGGTWTTLAA